VRSGLRRVATRPGWSNSGVAIVDGRKPLYPEHGALPHEQPLGIRLLGGFGLSSDGDDVPVAKGSQRLLAYLAVRRRPVPRMVVAGTLWPAVGEAHAYSALRSALARLDATSRSAVVVDDHDLALAPHVRVDLWDAEALAHRLLDEGTGNRGVDRLPAPAVLADDLLPGWYDDWALVEAESWRQLRLHALEALAANLMADGSFGDAALAALTAIRADPLRESPRAVLIRVHLAEGNPSEARTEYARYSELLARELHLEPTERLRSLLEGA
jgi:DNA-binding SARP family transcriptional activator